MAAPTAAILLLLVLLLLPPPLGARRLTPGESGQSGESGSVCREPVDECVDCRNGLLEMRAVACAGDDAEVGIRQTGP